MTTLSGFKGFSDFAGPLVGLVLIVGLAGCSTKQDDSAGSEGVAAEDVIRISLDSDDPERLLRFYFGSFLGPDGGDPVDAGILEKRENSWYLRRKWFAEGMAPELEQFILELPAGSVLEADGLESFVDSSYYRVRAFPQTLRAWREANGAWTEPEWFRIDVRGSMVPLRRSTWIRRSDIRDALDDMDSPDAPILYPEGTLIVGEHSSSGNVLETTLMRKRGDGFWDFWAYDAAGELTNLIKKDSRDMVIPTRCTGCHFGNRLFEPERSFPGVARPGPSGERTLFIPDEWRKGELATMLDEHARRSDSVLGLYTTLFLAELASGGGEEGDRRFLDKFGIAQRPQ